MSFEDDLRQALRREPAPPGFASRVVAKTRPRRTFPLAIAATLAVAALVPSGVYQYRQHLKAIEARDRLITALSITSDTLRHVQQQIQNTRNAQ